MNNARRLIKGKDLQRCPSVIGYFEDSLALVGIYLEARNNNGTLNNYVNVYPYIPTGALVFYRSIDGFEVKVNE